MQLTNKIKFESLVFLFLSISQKIMEFLTIIILSRLLQPEDFGLFGLAFAINGLIAVIGSLGIGLYIVYEKNISDSLLSFAFWLNLGISVILMIIAFLIAPALAIYFEAPELKPILYLLASSIFLTACGTIHLAILQKNLEFKKIGFIQAIITICGSILGIILALNGWGVYSFVIPIVINSLFLSLAYWIVQKWHPQFSLNFSYAKPILNYGKHIFIGDANSYMIQNVGYIIIGKFLSIQVLGYFKFSFSLAMALVFLFNDLANKLIMPLYSHLKQNHDLIREVVVRIFQYLTVFSVPAFTGLILISSDLIIVIFGEKWVPAINAFRILCMMGMFVVISRPIPAILNAFGKPNIRSAYTSIFLPLLIIISLFIVTEGFENFVIGYTLANIIFVLLMFIKTMHIIDLQGWQVIKQLAFIILPVFLMSIILYGIRLIPFLKLENDVLNLIIQIGIGAIVFIFALRFTNKKIFNLLYRPIVDMRSMESV